jgi:hypothetical protein
LGFPSGPNTSRCCATTIGADCACDGGVANCMAVRAVVASSANRRFVMCCGSRRMVVARNRGAKSVSNDCDQQTSVRPDCGELQTRMRICSTNQRCFDARVHDAFIANFARGKFHSAIASADCASRLQITRLPAEARTGYLDRVSATRQACRLATRRAIAVCQVPARAEEFPAADFRAALPAAVLSDVLAGSADLRSGRLASHRPCSSAH